MWQWDHMPISGIYEQNMILITLLGGNEKWMLILHFEFMQNMLRLKKRFKELVKYTLPYINLNSGILLYHNAQESWIIQFSKQL